MTLTRPGPGTTPGESGESVPPVMAAAGARLANQVVLRQIREWLHRDAEDQRRQALAWRLAWVVVGLLLAAGLVWLMLWRAGT